MFFSRLLYYLVLIPFSRLPFRVLYILSDFLYLVLYRVAGYRRKVVMANLRNSFPTKSQKELNDIAVMFYHHLCDLVVESVKLFTIAENQVRQRMVCRNPELMDQFFENNQSVILAGGHVNNWELFAVAIDSLIRHSTVGIYKPLSDRFLDAKMQKTRSKYGLKMIGIQEVKSFFETHKDELTATIFAIDQSPSSASRCYWTTFLNQETAVAYGTEKYALQYNRPVVFGRLFKSRRGHYELEFELVTPDPSKTSPGDITEQITRLLEADILQTPQFWLWSHRRWKRKRKHDEETRETLTTKPGL